MVITFRKFSPVLCFQALACGAAILLAAWVDTPWFGNLGLLLLVLGLTTVSVTRNEQARNWAMRSAWVGTPLVLAGLPLTPGQLHAIDYYHAVLAWLIAAATLLAIPGRPEVTCRGKILAATWAFGGVLLWLAVSYLRNEASAFYLGLLLGLSLLIGSKLSFRMPPYLIQSFNTVILIVIGLPIVDVLTRPTSRMDSQAALANKFYSYHAARKDPAAFGNWWQNYLEQWSQMGKAIFIPDPTGVLPFRLRPNSQGSLFDSRIPINSLGFRGREFGKEKGDAYRIVALGESTTFGCTLNAGDRPWPEILEQLIRERLQPRRPVEVINAGVPAYSLQHNLGRLQTEILPLRPDLIVSYHGANGFYLLDDAMPRPYGKLPPAYQRRPVKLLADAEYRLRMMRYRKQLDPGRLLDPAGFSNPVATKYGEAYRQLIQIAQTNRIRLVLANYAMVVNSRSDADVVQFYRVASPSIHWQIRANAVHTEIVKQLAVQNPEVGFVDTHPDLDGDTGKFIDVAHFTEAGRQQIAENFFAGIRRILEQDLPESMTPPAAAR